MEAAERRVALRRSKDCEEHGALVPGLTRSAIRRAGQIACCDATGRATLKRVTLRRAGTATSCSPVPPPTPGIVYWFKPDVGVTMDGANRVSLWEDQTANAYDVSPVDNAGVPIPVGRWPVFTPAVFPSGLAALDWGTNIWAAAGRQLQNNQAPASNLPLAPGAARTVLAMLIPANAEGGRVVTFRRNANAITFEMATQEHLGGLLGLPFHAKDYDVPSGNNTVLGGSFIPIPTGTPAAASSVDFTGVPIILCWELAATGALVAYVNNVPFATYTYSFANGSAPGASLLLPDTGLPGFTLGTTETDGSVTPWQGFYGETVCYAGVDATLRTAWFDYLLARMT